MWPFVGPPKGLGAGLVVSEMVVSDELVKGYAEAQLRAEGSGVEPHVVQLAGCDPRSMAEGVRIAEAAGARVVDINMGCPAKRVIGGYAGSALMRDLDHACRLIEASVSAATVPVTVKMRLGWDERSLNAPELARRAEALGVQAITVHGRTRQQFYKGEADWKAISAVVDAVTIPVIANGDIGSLDDARRCLAQSRAAAVMVGRCAVGRPWLVGQIGAGLQGRDDRGPVAGGDDRHRRRALRGSHRPLRREGRHPARAQASRRLRGCRDQFGFCVRRRSPHEARHNRRFAGPSSRCCSRSMSDRVQEAA